MKLFSPIRPRILLFNKFLTKIAIGSHGIFQGPTLETFLKWDLEVFHGTL